MSKGHTRRPAALAVAVTAFAAVALAGCSGGVNADITGVQAPRGDNARPNIFPTPALQTIEPAPMSSPAPLELPYPSSTASHVRGGILG